MLGAILGLGYAAFFGANNIFVRRGVLRVSSNVIATLTIFTGPVFFFLLTLVTGDLLKIPGFTLKAIIYFALSGIVHFAMGRTFGYRANQILGATRAGIMTGLNAIVSIILAISILKETLTPLMILGICFSLSGPIIMGLKEANNAKNFDLKSPRQLNSLDRKTFFKGILFGAGAAFFWGSSSIFIKLGLEAGGSSLAGSFIAYTAASFIVSFSLLNRKNRDEIIKVDKQSFKLAMISGFTTNMAQMLRYLAFSYGTVIVVSLASRTMPIWTLLLSFIFNRKLESFSRWVLLGNAMLVIGTILVLMK
ncbi:MAG: DMT family transporter [Dehalococcoidia bacterium]|nr:DMT family transporter [Dehalococcoidia bacterium]MDZ4247622.1 DMT family transporter [Dehalococcoidia bacterium]